MTTPQGPPCDLCKEEPAVMSVMNLIDHEQLLIGPACLLPYFKGMVGAMSGAEGDTDGQGDADAQTPAPGSVPPAADGAGPPAAPTADPPARPRARKGARA